MRDCLLAGPFRATSGSWPKAIGSGRKVLAEEVVASSDCRLGRTISAQSPSRFDTTTFQLGLPYLRDASSCLIRDIKRICHSKHGDCDGGIRRLYRPG